MQLLSDCPASSVPTGEELMAAPQLSALAILDAALLIAADALFSAHPELLRPKEPKPRQDQPTEVWLADYAIAQATMLRDTLLRYRHALDPNRDPSSDTRQDQDEEF